MKRALYRSQDDRLSDFNLYFEQPAKSGRRYFFLTCVLSGMVLSLFGVTDFLWPFEVVSQ